MGSFVHYVRVQVRPEELLCLVPKLWVWHANISVPFEESAIARPEDKDVRLAVTVEVVRPGGAQSLESGQG